MSKKILAALIAAMLILTASAAAFAAPEDTAAPATTAAPTTAPVDIDAFIAQVKALCQNVNTLKDQLKTEKKIEQKMVSGIHSLKGVVHSNQAQLDTYRSQIADLNEQANKLQEQLKSTKDKDKKKEIQNQIKDLTNQIKELTKKLNKINHNTLKEFRAQLKTEYAKLKPLFQLSNTLKQEMFALIDRMKAAIVTGDITVATDLLAQITSKMDALNENIRARITIREGIQKMLDEYKTSLTK